MQFWIIQVFNGISYGALLFLLASGLSLIFGVMRIVNLAHGSYFLLGGYIALTVIWTTGSWLLAIPVSALAVAVLGLAMERVFLRRLGGDALRQVLLTVGFALLFQQAALDIWGGDNMDIKVPPALASDPKLLLLDEPAAGLSTGESHEMATFLNELDPNLAILMIEHDMDVAFAVVNNLTVLHYGEIVETGSPEQIRSSQRVREIYLGTG
ncbi:MAG: hypothetical protein O7G88_09990 [bacterium]|nr:hypothetical protein [bacterium]